MPRLPLIAPETAAACPGGTLAARRKDFYLRSHPELTHKPVLQVVVPEGAAGTGAGASAVLGPGPAVSMVVAVNEHW